MQAPRQQGPAPAPPQISVEDSVLAADVAEQILPGGAGLVQGLVRAEREVLRGLAALVEANVHQLDAIDASIPDPNRPRFKGGIGRGLLYLAVKRAASIHATISQVESAFLQGLAASVLGGPPSEGGGPPQSKGPERVKIE